LGGGVDVLTPEQTAEMLSLQALALDAGKVAA